ncbi:winged helix-turn-helix transcriptional regulator [Paenibacillus sp. GSMTC-2017]|uniref:ArsR/SmtB family transcription factor n=1 Tax=Paenibacillus sp. GSMTC-2017 TaxID=2794350 RepID=UPI0018D61EA5|nr:metalloregulator ArsR/SmtB family transcription factor [Paenibacillus sp. GSMTC-2017]MBH5320459.1 winged helix-turn-helix transcriptional regulator [Paenibacillus sp. GSMTC-2017]
MNTTLQALAEPNRLRIVELLLDGPLTVGEIADRLSIRQPQASKHLKTLSDAGLVEVKQEANKRIYSLRSEPLQQLDSWLDTFRTMWADRFKRMDDYLQLLQSKPSTNDEKNH